MTNPDAERVNPLPGNLLQWVRALDADYDEKDTGRVFEQAPEKANVLTSYVGDERCEDVPSGEHRPVLDIDFPVTVLESSTPGHHHLLIDKPMSWEAYAHLLYALEAAGLIESGYLGASLERGHTTVRLPWVPKREEQAKAKEAELIAHYGPQVDSGQKPALADHPF